MTKIKSNLEDYVLRYVPHSFRTWSPQIIAITALGGIAYLADLSIGASIGIAYGTINALYAILLAAIIIFITGLPLAYYSSRYNIDLDLITRGCGFGYYGSIITSIIFASFTFIFFALEGSIMAQGLLVGLNIPLSIGYLITTLMVIPLVIYGMKALSKLQLWTTPIWLLLMAAPVIILIHKNPLLVNQFFNYAGSNGKNTLNIASIIAGSGIALALIGQIGEQIDYLRLMPAPTNKTRKAWWISIVIAGPGWVFIGAIKQIIGIFLALYVINKFTPALAVEPVYQMIGAFNAFLPSWLAIILAVTLVVISQIKINVTNAYSGSLAWTNTYTRITKHYPGRIVFVLFNLSIALILMETNMFKILGFILGFYSNCAIAWIGIVATDIVINKHILHISPKEPEFRKGMLYPINPVGVITFFLACALSIITFFGVFGKFLIPYAPMIALIIACVVTPLLAIITKGKYYLRKTDDGIVIPRFNKNGTPSDEIILCDSCGDYFERPDMSKIKNKYICSLCETIT